MYMKIRSLKRLKEMGFLYPQYQVISINEDNPKDIEKYVLEKIRLVNVPNIKNDRIGVTIRVSLLGSLDKIGKHGGLHVIDENEILKIVLQKHEQYKPMEKIILQHRLNKVRKTGLKIEIINSDKPIEEVVRDFDKVLRKYEINIKDKSKSKIICVLGKRKYYGDSNN